ncbi:GNAT family N-acetyltransferase [Streptomyces sp. 8L]|uniref:GNAT family N-acetyltransferase n=1 Tax=Streptomyces sp. 8L TaxID=2877242 RepID=UPI001CD45710|nr:GNAT family N-acetyltransferase [Streptomyces sp. 8L]MCA1220432.1 GNAT family N-acetyltransferase [Streptomyces sp. 8L]
MSTGLSLREATTVAELITAQYLFDGTVREEWARRFLGADGHVMLIAYLDGTTPVGFVSGVEMSHPDKGTEMALYELEVAEPYRRMGIGRALTRALASRAGEHGCYGMWVGADTDNVAARSTYLSAGARDEGPSTILAWNFDTAPRTGPDGAGAP